MKVRRFERGCRSVKQFMPDLREAVCQLEAQGFALAITDVTFKSISYFVIIKQYANAKPKSEKFALARLEFVPKNDLSGSMEWPANTRGLIGDAKEIRKFFQIPYAVGGVGNALNNLYEHIGNVLLANLRLQPQPEERSMIVDKLSTSDSEDPNRVHCFAVRRNSINPRTKKREQRSLFNSQKAAILRPALYQRLKSDTGISFNFSTDPLRERSDTAIYESFVGS